MYVNAYTNSDNIVNLFRAKRAVQGGKHLKALYKCYCSHHVKATLHQCGGELNSLTQ